MHGHEKDKLPFFHLHNETYATTVQLRLTYTLVGTMGLLASFGIGLALQAFISIYEIRLAPRHVVICIFITAAGIIFLSLICDELWLFVYDATHQPPLARSRAFMCAFFGHEHISRIDGIGIVSFELAGAVPAVFAAIRFKGNLAMIAFAYVLGNVSLCVLLAAAGVCTKLVVKFMPSVNYAQCRMEVVLRSARSDESYENLFARVPRPSLIVDIESMKLIEFSRDVAMRSLSYMSMAVLLQLCSYLAVEYGTQEIGIALSFALFNASVFLDAKAIREVFPRGFGRTFKPLMSIFALSSILMTFAAYSEIDVSEENDLPLFEPERNEPVQRSRELDEGYPLCGLRFGSRSILEEERLTVLDMISFADAAYARTQDGAKNKIVNATHGSHLAEGVELEDLEDPLTVGRWAIFKIPAAKTRVLAIRGTQTIPDIIADVDLWAGIKLLQAFSILVPVVQLLPECFTKKLISVGSMRAMLGESRLWSRLLLTAAKAKKHSQEDGYALVVTGHSLGGGLAQIVGASLHLPTLVFSPVGVKYSSERFGIQDRDVSKYVTVVQPRHDIVPEVDVQVGFTQLIDCQHDAATCHILMTTTCELYKSCGDRQGRTLAVHTRTYCSTLEA